jgi:hypothetical protein
VNKKALFKGLAAVIALFLVAGVYASSSVTINNSNPVNLGAGSQRVTTCDNDVFIDPPGMTFDAVQQKYLITTISVSQISQLSPSACGNWIMELVLGYQGGYQMTSWSIPSSAIDSTLYFGGTNVGTGMAKTTLSPIDPSIVQNIALQMYPGISCADGGICSLGDNGPGGGPVIYAAASPFTEPVSGKKYRYIEAAPAYWSSGVIDPRTSICNVPPGAIASSLPEAIGYAKSNTDAIIADSVCTGISSSSIPSGLQKSAVLARTLGNDWNIPTYQELIEMCKIARFGATVAPAKTNCNDSGGSAPTGWLSVAYATSSKKVGAGYASTVNFTLGVANNDGPIQSSNFGLRPIRYFG